MTTKSDRKIIFNTVLDQSLYNVGYIWETETSILYKLSSHED